MAQDLTGKVFLVTGATEGIGKAAATNFAKRGATVTLIGRNKEKTERVLTELKAASGNHNLDCLVCDLSRLADVRRAAEDFKAKHGRLDVLVNNAGATFKSPVMGPDGFELTFALNHLSHFQLTHSLFDLIRQTPGHALCRPQVACRLAVRSICRKRQPRWRGQDGALTQHRNSRTFCSRRNSSVGWRGPRQRRTALSRAPSGLNLAHLGQIWAS